MSEDYDTYRERVSQLGISPLARDVWQRGEARAAWVRRMNDLEAPLNEEEVEKLMVELRNVNASHTRHMATLYAWASTCPHDTDHLEAEQPYYVGDGPPHPDTDEHHQRDEDGELFCLLSPVGEECVCGDGYCERLSELASNAEEFWHWIGGAGVPR